LEKGSPAGLFLNFAIFLISIAFSASATLCTSTNFINAITQTIFIVVAVVGFIVGLLLLILWYRGRTDIKTVAKKIRDRIPPESPEVLLALEPNSNITKEELLPPKEPKDD
jgi:uncharacterized membrane protein YciS (DUF1049 family)